MKCQNPSCNNIYNDKFIYCPYCGEKTPPPKYCDTCRKTIEERDFKYCPSCGKILRDKESIDYFPEFKAHSGRKF